MKRFLLLASMLLLSLSFVFSSPVVNLGRDNPDNPLDGRSEVRLVYDYDPERYYRFMFSDRLVDKDGNFDDLFASAGLQNVLLSKIVDGHLESDKTLYVYWMLDNSLPISKLTIEVSNPLLMAKSGDTLDLYVSCDNKAIIGGTNGYGQINAATLYDRRLDDKHEELTDYVRLNMWTGDIRNKPAGNYEGSVVLRVYAEDDD